MIFIVLLKLFYQINKCAKLLCMKNARLLQKIIKTINLVYLNWAIQCKQEPECITVYFCDIYINEVNM